LLEAYDFDLPAERVAQHPVQPRDAARMLCVAAGDLQDAFVRDLPQRLRPGDLMIVNDTRVIPAQLVGVRGAARIPVTLNRPLPDGAWHALARNTRRLRAGAPA
jgi:S-adenosylmethionine:tRNA ribosyltransferase-isomerase